ncbi:MAG: aminoglycoside phosphotransferase family protein [Planctomycetes bacterium]|nr:aminoglycoside phosphotransferase family protein [Planctomycetota bacterium]
MSALPIPQDDCLPGLKVLLDGDRVKAILEPGIQGTGNVITDCRVDYVRYHPATSCMATYLVTVRNGDGTPRECLWYGKCLTQDEFPKVRERAMGRARTQPPLGSPVTAVPEHQLILFAYPNDFRLEGLPTVADEESLRKVLCRYNGARSLFAQGRLLTTLLRYKPEKRAILRCEVDGSASGNSAPAGTAVYLKTYSDDRGRGIHEKLARIVEHFGIQSHVVFPRPIGYAADHHLQILGAVPGTKLTPVLGTPDQYQALARLGEALVEVHAYHDAELPHITLADWQERARQDIDQLQQFMPALQGQLRDISDRLRSQAPADNDCWLGFVHAECHPGNLFVDSRTIGFLDFDRAHTGCTTVDLGKMLAHLRCLRNRGRVADDGPLREVFLEAYMKAAKRTLQPEVVGWWMAVQLLQMTVKTARRLDSGDPEKVEVMVREVAEALR